MGYFDSVDVQGALAMKRQLDDARAAALVTFWAAADRFATDELPEMVLEFISIARQFKELLPIPGGGPNAWRLGDLHQDMDSEGSSVRFYADAECNLYYDRERIRHTEFPAKLVSPYCLATLNAARLRTLGDEMSPYVRNAMARQLTELTRPTSWVPMATA